tara:strand:+ start:253 stop:420 length:168 start_codon:yes stop_codon:yes gene_type:complete
MKEKIEDAVIEAANQIRKDDCTAIEAQQLSQAILNMVNSLAQLNNISAPIRGERQ